VVAARHVVACVYGRAGAVRSEGFSDKPGSGVARLPVCFFALVFSPIRADRVAGTSNGVVMDLAVTLRRASAPERLFVRSPAASGAADGGLAMVRIRKVRRWLVRNEPAARRRIAPGRPEICRARVPTWVARSPYASVCERVPAQPAGGSSRCAHAFLPTHRVGWIASFAGASL